MLSIRISARGPRGASVLFAGVLAFALVGPGLATAPDERLVVRIPADAQRIPFDRIVESYATFLLVEMRATDFFRARAAGIAVEDITPLFTNGLLEAARRTTAAQDAYVVQFLGPVKSGWPAALAASGASVSHYVGAFAFAVAMDEATAARVVSLPAVRAVLPYPQEDKVDAALRGATGPTAVEILTFRGQGATVARQLTEMGASVLWSRSLLFGDVMRVHMEGKSLPAAAALPYVTMIAPVPRGEPLLPQVTWIIQSNLYEQRPIWDQGIHGEGQLVAFADTGLQYDHYAFRDPDNPFVQVSDPPASLPPDPNHRKVANYLVIPPGGDSDDGNGFPHGTPVASIIAGDPSVNGVNASYRGVAYAARLVVNDVVSGSAGDWDMNLTDMYNVTRANGAFLHSNSWGNPGTGSAYTLRDAETDAFHYAYPDFLAIYAAGNEGDGLSTLRSPGSAKDIVTVGATENGMTNNRVIDYSSRGPTLDGRLKPTVMAPTNVIAAEGNGAQDAYGSFSGTSAATPVVGGTSVLVRQYFTDGFYPLGYRRPDRSMIPSGTLVKAMLVNSGDEMSTSSAYTYPYNGMAWPTNSQGWGRVLLDDAMYFRGDARRLYVHDEPVGVTTGTTWETNITVLDASQPLKITLVWFDFAGSPPNATDPKLVNDLDLEVVDAFGSFYLGNVFTGVNPARTEANAGTPDRLNVEEQVILPPGWLSSGNFTVRVHGFNVPQGSQRFALVVTGAIAGPDNVPPLVPGLSGADLTNSGDNVTIMWTAAPDEGLPGGTVAYDVYRSDVYVPDGTGYTYLGTMASAAQTTYGYVDAGAGVGDPLDHFYYVVGKDGEGNIGPWAGQAAKLRLPLPAGPSLWSHPLLLSDATWDVTLVAANAVGVWHYDGSDAVDPWASWSIARGGGDMGSAAPPPGRGLWVISAAAGNTTVAGFIPPSVNVEVVPGWNLVGYASLFPGTVGTVRTAAGCTDAQGHDDPLPYRLRVLNDGDVLAAGDALWLRCPAAATITFLNS